MALTVVHIIEGLGVLALFGMIIALVAGNRTLANPHLRNMMIGVAFGVLIIVVMLDPIRLSEGATFDARGGPAILAGIFAGPIGAIVSATIGALARYHIVGGPVAFGGAVGFYLYALFGILVWIILRRTSWQFHHPIRLAIIGMLGTVAVIPAFFVSTSADIGLQILQKAGLILLINNVASTVLIGTIYQQASRWVRLNKDLADESKRSDLLARVANETTNGVIITDFEGRTEWVNHGFERLSSFSAKELLGKRPGDVLQGPGTDPKVVWEMSAAIKAKEPFDVTVLNYRATGEPYWVQISCQPFKDLGGDDHFLAIQTNVTEKIKAQEELIQARDIAVNANNAKSEFLAGMSHELRTPMNAILGFAQMLCISEKEPLTKAQNNYVNSILDGGEHLNRLLNDILDLAKIEADQISISVEPVMIGDVVHSSIKMTEPLAEQRGIKLINEIDLGTTAQILTDRSRLIQVTTNLITNGIKYNSVGGSVTIKGEVRDSEYYRVSIIDTGVGISPEGQELIFDMFHRLNTNSMVTQDGIGIGLSVARGLTDKLGGTIGVDSQTGQGSTFWFEMPLETNTEVLIWSDEFRVGIDSIDSDHQKIFSLTNVLAQSRASDTQLDHAIQELMDYTSYHFEREEEIMMAIGYPDLENHKTYHRNLIKQMNQIAEAWHRTKTQKTRHDLRVFLKNWWTSHITNVDTTLAEYAKGKESKVRRLERSR